MKPFRFVLRSQFLNFVRKEYYHIFRDVRTMLILLAMPIAQIILFGFAITTEVKNVQTGIFAPSDNTLAQRMAERFQANNYFTVTQIFHNPEEVDEAFRKGKIHMALVFSGNFDENVRHTGDAAVQLIADATDPNQALTLTGYATNIINAELRKENGNPSFSILPEVRMLYNPQMKGAYNFVPGVMGLILTLVCAMMTSIAIVRESEIGTMEVLLTSPVRPVCIILAKAVPYFTLSVVNLLTILLLSVYVLGVPIAGSLFWLVITSLIFIITALSLGLFISTMVKTQVAAMLVSGMALMMPVMLLSGLIFPIESMPLILQWISNLIPAHWYIDAVKKLMIQGVDVRYIVKELGILMFMAVFLIVVSLKKFKIRLG
ncbi:MAG: ABC-2 type transport system permease protein [Candidatus Ordinivivax streblomastigis]|uniref:Transport permease protein n=1 Tax=Candidatus Ordinivivax streblomastigis TaxID=2540710 RepID=A0A5M8NY84_9BACT|nr:MAG: ABC-2 type transport system permease protein [Candidatus Ordinivivax streblomastigis]